MSAFLSHPGSPGGFGGLMDEYARAADEFCALLESISDDAFVAPRESDDPDCTSIAMVCRHVISAAGGYCHDLLKARGEDTSAGPGRGGDAPRSGAEVRARLAVAIRATEDATMAMRDWTGKQVMDLRFVQPWGQIYDPEILLEHAICHVLRHRRQIERWLATDAA